MTRPKWNYLVDVVMFTLMGTMIFVGVIMGFFLTSGPVADRSLKYVWGLHLHQWGDIHAILSFIFVAFFILHIILHWSWIRGATKKLMRSPVALVLILMLPALIILLAWSFSEKDSPDYMEYGHRAGAEAERVEQPQTEETIVAKKVQAKKVEINGRMSLKDVETATGVQAAKIAKALGLPPDAPLDQNLGRLRRSYNFEMKQVRDMVTGLSGGKIEAVDSDTGTHDAQPSPGHEDGQEQKGQRRKEINGRLTLQDVQRITGVSASAIVRKLKLPPDTPLNERLGRLRKRHGFSMHDVREAVSALGDK